MRLPACQSRKSTVNRWIAPFRPCHFALGKRALQFAAERGQVRALLIGQWLSALTHAEALRAHRGAEAFGELARVDDSVGQSDPFVPHSAGGTDEAASDRRACESVQGRLCD